MGYTVRRIMMLLAMATLLATGAWAQTAADLTPFLQAELTKINVLTAQYQDLQRRGNVVTAATIASYIPDHQMQVCRLSAAIQLRGGDVTRISASTDPAFTGDRLAVVRHDLQRYQQAVTDYRALLQRATDPEIQRIATLGLNADSRHFSSLQVALASFTDDEREFMQGILAALTLERAAIADLQTQAARLTALNDTSTANALLAMIPQHQAQAQRFESVITQMGGNPALAVPAPTAQLATRNEILMNARTFDTQLANTYALPIATLPVDNAFRVAALQGQQNAFAALTQWQRFPITV